MIKQFQDENTSCKSLISKPLFMASGCFLATYVTNLVLTFVLATIVFDLTSSTFDSYTFVQMLYIVMPALTLSVAFLPFLFAKIQKISFIQDYKIRWCGVRNIICAIFLGIILVFLMVFVSGTFLSILEYFGIVFPETYQPTAETVPQLIAEIICIALFPAIFEEILVRGYLRKNLENYFNQTTVIIITAVLFAFLHGDIRSFIPTFIAGIYLAYLVYRTNSIIPSMIVHFVNNALITCITFFGNFADTEPASESAISTLSDLYTAVIFYAVPVVILFGISLYVMNFCKKIPSPDDDEIDSFAKYRARPLAWVLFGCCFVFSIIIYVL